MISHISNSYTLVPVYSYLLCRVLDQLICLVAIDLSGNAKLGNRGCLSLIRSCSIAQTLKQIKLAGCGISSPVPNDVWQEVDLRHLTLLDLSGNKLNESDRSRILRCLGSAHVPTTSGLIFILRSN